MKQIVILSHFFLYLWTPILMAKRPLVWCLRKILWTAWRPTIVVVWLWGQRLWLILSSFDYWPLMSIVKRWWILTSTWSSSNLFLPFSSEAQYMEKFWFLFLFVFLLSFSFLAKAYKQIEFSESLLHYDW